MSNDDSESRTGPERRYATHRSNTPLDSRTDPFHDARPGRLITSDAANGLSRRSVLLGSLSAGTVAVLPLTSCSTVDNDNGNDNATPAVALPLDLALVLDAFAERIIPADEYGPGAVESGVSRYITRSLAQWNQNDVPLVIDGLRNIEQLAVSTHAQGFAALPAAEQDALMLAMETSALPGFENAPQVFNRLHRLVLEGMFSDPWYGGNASYAGWDLIGYPGAVLGSTVEMQQMGGRLPALHTSAYGEQFDGAAHDEH